MRQRDSIEHAAALWVVRLERGLTAAEQDEFIDWLTADPRHAEELDAQKKGWDKLDLIADWRPEHGATPNRDLLAPSPVTRRRILVWSGLGLAAACLIGLFAVQVNRSAGSVAPRPPEVLIALIEQRELEDGSVISLNRGAKINVSYSAIERRIELTQGEAHFQVAKNPERPFIVSAQGVDIRAVGTAFNVRFDHALVEVLVTEGRVGVRSTSSESEVGGWLADIHLDEGQRATVTLDEQPVPRVETVTPQGMQAALAWQPRLLEFDHAPLAEIVAELNRRNAPIRIEIADWQLERQPLNAAIRSDNIEGFVRLLESGFRMRVQRAGDRITLHAAAPR